MASVFAENCILLLYARSSASMTRVFFCNSSLLLTWALCFKTAVFSLRWVPYARFRFGSPINVATFSRSSDTRDVLQSRSMRFEEPARNFSDFEEIASSSTIKVCQRHSTSSTIQRNRWKMVSFRHCCFTLRQCHCSSGQIQYTQRVPQGPSFFRLMAYDAAVSRRDRRSRSTVTAGPRSRLIADKICPKNKWCPKSTKHFFPDAKVRFVIDGK